MFKKAIVMFSIMLLGLSLFPMCTSAAPDLDQRFTTFQGDQLASSDIFDMSDDGTILLAADTYNNWVQVYSTTTGGKVWGLDAGKINVGEWFKADLSGDGSHVVTADQFGLVSYYNIASGNASVWSDNASQNIYGLSISKDGSKVAIGMTGGIIFYGLDGIKTTYTNGTTTFNVAISGNGNRTLAVAGDQLLFFNSTNDLRRTVTLPNIGLEVFLSDDGLSGAVSMSDGTVRFMQFSNQVVPNNYNWDHDFGTGYPDIVISRDGSTALVRTVEGISVYDIGLSSVRWTKDTDYAFVSTSGDLSGDGSIVAIPCYSAGQLRIYDSWTGDLIQNTDVYDPSFVKVSADGETVAVLAYTIIVFRPSLTLIVGSEAWTVTSGQTASFWLEVKDGEVPVEGATINVTTPGIVSVISVTDKGDGRYWIQVSPVTITETSSYGWQAVVSLDGYGNGSVSGTLTVIGTDDPQNTMLQIEDMKNDLNDTQAELQTANDKIDSLQTMQFVALGVMIALGLVIIVLLLRRRPN